MLQEKFTDLLNNYKAYNKFLEEFKEYLNARVFLYDNTEVIVTSIDSEEWSLVITSLDGKITLWQDEISLCLSFHDFVVVVTELRLR